MNKDLADVLFESLDTIATHNSRLDKLDKTSKEVKASVDKLQAYLELKIEEATSSALKEVLDNISITNDIKPVNEISINTDALASEISKLINTKFNNSVNVEPANIQIDIDTKAIADKLDNTSVLESISKQIDEANKANRVLLTEMINIQRKEPKAKDKSIKSIKIIRDKDGLIDSLDIVKG
jgi:hypothetical protein